MKNDRPFSQELFEKAPIIGIVRGWDLETVLWIAEVCSKAGLYTLEVTMNTPNAPNIISKTRKDFPGLNIGAGTVCSLEELKMALDAGAQFIVTPILDKWVIKNCVQNNIPIFPGASTPTEIHKAWDLGASAVKVFPAGQFGPGYIKDVLAPLDKIRLVPTGGVTKDNIKSYFEAGAVGVGIGGSLLDRKLILDRDAERLKRHAMAFKGEIEDYPL